MSSVHTSGCSAASVALRAELKDWERIFATANGRKPGRHDIKQNAAIAAKYKEYTKQRQPPTPTGCPTSPSTTPARGHKRTTNPTESSQLIQTPKRARHDSNAAQKHMPLHPASLDPYDSPARIRALTLTPSQRKPVGPTPQKDGKCLGLFDLLSEPEDAPAVTPSRTGRRTSKPAAAGDGGAGKVLVGTPSRAGSRTPASGRKTSRLADFLTPLKRKRDDDVDNPSSSVSKLQFSTPSFLRREAPPHHSRPHLTAIDKDEGAQPKIESPIFVRMPAKPPVRGLSSILANLRKLDDERMDDEMDVLRELENDAVGATKPRASGKTTGAKVLVEDSQILAPDHDPADDDDDASADDEVENEEIPPPPNRDGRPPKIWKKKGQKRTTRKVLMRPVRANPRPSHHPPTTSYHTDDDDRQSLYSDVDHPPNPNPSPPPQTTDDTIPNPTTSAAAAAAYAAATLKAEIEKPPEKKKRKVGAPRKVNALAHANFQRLKLRGKGGGGGGAGKGMGRGRGRRR
ncbi:MAG: DNA replication regulator sld2 [Caeruleum heppii]|nr:MAG: DNA replication regulator sld2 [Caeruleum heppii]